MRKHTFGLDVGFDVDPWRRGEPALLAETAVRSLFEEGRSVKLDLKESGSTLTDVLELIDDVGIADDRPG